MAVPSSAHSQSDEAFLSIFNFFRWQEASNLPKTRSGKIMRRVLRKIARDESDFGDISTLADPSVVETLRLGRQELFKPKAWKSKSNCSTVIPRCATIGFAMFLVIRRRLDSTVHCLALFLLTPAEKVILLIKNILRLFVRLRWVFG